MKGYKPSHIQKKIALKKKVAKRKRFFKSRVFFDFLLWFLLLASFGYLLIFSQVFKIKDIQIVSFERVPKEMIGKIVQEEMQSKVLFLLKRDSFFLLDTNKLKLKISNEFPLISDIHIKKGLNHSLFIEAKPRIPQAVWCFYNGQECFLIDNKRIVFERLKNFQSFDKNLIAVNSEGYAKPIFSQICSDEMMKRIIETNKTFNDLGIFNVIFLEKANGFLYAQTPEKWIVFFNPKQDLNLDLTKLNLLLTKELSFDKRKTLEYIDLRFSKAYYK